MATESQPAKRPETLEEFHAKWLGDALADLAARLRDGAERVERCADQIQRVGTPGTANYGTVAADALSEIQAMLGNLMTERMVREAAAADVARAKGE